MVIHGDDSLNHNSEDEGITPSSPMADAGPTLEQLIATHEIDPEDINLDEEIEEMSKGPTDSAVSEIDPEDLPFPPEGDEEVPDIEGDEEEVEEEDLGTDVMAPDDADLSIRKQVEAKLLAGATREELIAEGYNKNTVRTVASEIKTKTGSKKPVGRAVAKSVSGIPAYAKGSPPEFIIEAITLPDVAGGGGATFESGMKFGLSVAVLGIRMAQELSGIGIQQAKPILDMAKSMREGEGLAAKNAAGEAAFEAASMVQNNMTPLLAALTKNAPTSSSGDPMKDMMARQMEPIMSKMMSGVLGSLMPGLQAPAADANPQLSGPGVDGWNVRNEEE